MTTMKGEALWESHTIPRQNDEDEGVGRGCKRESLKVNA